ncbi:MAG: alcohol dehydrogenase class IV [Kiritimatiellia bacterium]|jgi:alcohol dehydrogenase class IV
MIAVRPGAVGLLGEALAELPVDDVLLVVGDRSWQAAREPVMRALDGRRVEVYSGFRNNPRIDDVDAGIRLLRTLSRPAVVAVGGGSAIDMGKLIALFSAQPGPPAQMLGQDFVATDVPVIAVPTTAGTGSEATPFATVYAGRVKHSASHASILPAGALVDAQLAMSMPAYVTACTGLDALVQAVESMWAVRSTDESMSHARVAIVLALAHLPAAVQRPTLIDRTVMAEAAWHAGCAIAHTRTTACHALSYPMTIGWGVPHGHAVALTLAAMVEHNGAVRDHDCVDARGAAAVRVVIDEICALFGVAGPAAFRARWVEFVASLGLATSLSAVGITTEADLLSIVDAVNLQRLANNPRAVARDDMVRLLCSLG